MARARAARDKSRPARGRRRRREWATSILFLAANATGAHRLALDLEVLAIQKELELSSHRDCFELETRWAAEPLDMLRELRKLKPTVVHLSGHGESNGLRFQAADGRTQVVTAEALAGAFSAAGASVKLLVLRASYSEKDAEVLLAHVDCVVWISGGIDDNSARSFSIGFYGGLLERESVAAAHRQGGAAIALDGQLDGDRLNHLIRDQLKLLSRDGVDAGKLVLSRTRNRPELVGPAVRAA